MKNIYLEISNGYLSEAVQRAAFDCGIQWNYGSKEINRDIANHFARYSSRVSIAFDSNGMRWASREGFYKGEMKLLSLDEFFNNWLPNYKKHLKIGNYEVKDVTKDGFKVGCQEVTWLQYDQIGKLRP